MLVMKNATVKQFFLFPFNEANLDLCLYILQIFHLEILLYSTAEEGHCDLAEIFILV